MTDTSFSSPIHVLVVDDHPNTALTLARAVTQMGPHVKVISATSGREALERVRDHPVDILVTDMIMPEMNGLELIEKLQVHPAGRPIYTILITAYDVPGLKETARRLKVDEIIPKPVRPERICQSVERVLQRWNEVKPASALPSSRRPPCILIADDLPDNVTLLSRYMQSEGYDYITAQDGLEVLEKARREKPDLILLDVNMPRLDGFAALEQLRADPDLQTIPVIILTAARLDPLDIQTGLNLGADDYVTKPFDRRELMARIRNKLRVKQTGDQLVRQNRELSMVLEVTALLNRRTSPEVLVAEVLELIVERLGAVAGYIALFENDIQRFYPSEAPPPNLPSIKEYLQKTHQVEGERLDRVANHDFWREALPPQALSAIYVPLRNRFGLLVGLILLIHNTFSYFEASHLPILQAIANQIVVAMENLAWYKTISEKHTSS